jgi:hypothetical protein
LLRHFHRHPIREIPVPPLIQSESQFLLVGLWHGHELGLSPEFRTLRTV